MAESRHPESPSPPPVTDPAAAGQTLSDVLDWEATRVRERRHVVDLDDADANGDVLDTAGLALSGGGIRSACFNMGLLQAFHRGGLFRCFDYLSTVSGGGYLGVYLTSWFRHARQPVTSEHFPLREEDAGHRQNSAVKQLIYGGDYIVKPVSAFNKYLIGVILNNIALFSLLVTGATLIAFAYRSLDFPAVRDRLQMIGWNSDLTAPFLPSLLFLLLWIAAWMVSYFQRQAEAPGLVARYLLRLLVASVLVGCAMLVGNGDIPLSWRPAASEPFSIPEAIWVPLVVLIVVMLLPVLRPQRLIASAARPRRPYEKWIFRGTCSALLGGVPLILVGYIGRENISGYSTFPDRGLHEADIRNWPQLCSLVLSWKTPPGGGSPGTGSGESDASNGARILVTEEQDRRAQLRLERLRTLACEIIAASHRERNCRHQLDVRWPDEQEFETDRWTAARWRRIEVDDEAARLVTLACWLAGVGNDGEAAAWWQASREHLALRQQFVDEWNEALLLSPWLTRRLVTESAEQLRREREEEAAHDSAWALALIDARNAAITQSRSATTAFETGRANRRLMERLWPDMIRPATDIQRRIVIFEDQWYRAEIAVVALLLFVVFGFVDINATSMHRYYRTRLTEAFLIPPDSDHSILNLSDLDTTEFGGPYHLIGTTVSLTGRRAGASDDTLTIRPTKHDLERDPRTQDTFLMSPGFTGSVATGYEPTRTYEKRIVGRTNHLTADEAMALSGAAVSPSQNTNPLIAFLMFSLNLRLGQWLPNPRRARPKMRPRLHYLLASLLRTEERRPYVFVTDGGHNENLGVVELLKRRCRLIVVSDAGFDPEHRFDDLAQAIRTSRVFGGVRIEPLIDGRGREFSVAPLKLSPRSRVRVDANSDSLRADQEPPLTRQHFLVGRILYPRRDDRQGPAEGLIVFIKPSLTGDESLDVLQYQRENPHFPHQPTSDQVFESAQVESYRQLGYHIGQEFCRMVAGTSPSARQAAAAHRDEEFGDGLDEMESEFHTEEPLHYRSVRQLTELIAAAYRREYGEQPGPPSGPRVRAKG